MKETTAVYPGTFDPMTQGHFDLIRRSAALFDQLIVAVAGISPKPTRLFGIEERVAMVQECLAEGGITNAVVKPLDCLLVEFCRRNNVRAVVRGLRAYSDFEYEFQSQQSRTPLKRLRSSSSSSPFLPVYENFCSLY